MKEEHVREDYVLQALGALAEYDREKQAPPEVEARLVGLFHARRRFRRRWMALAAMAASLMMIALLLWPNRKPTPVVSSVPGFQAPVTARPAALAVENVPRAPRKAVHKVAPSRPSQPREVVTDFFPLMNPALSFERGQMLRVQLPAAAMQSVGLPVREEDLGELVQADVLVGEEGMARAIRFVRFDVK
jgi:hypothetical protein